MYEERTKGSIFRSKARWYKEGEKITKYFYRLERQRFNHKTMSCVVLSDCSISRRQKDILCEQALFCKKLYSMDTNIEFTFVNRPNCKLSDQSKNELDLLIKTSS